MLTLSKDTAQEDTMQLQFAYDGMGNRIRKDYWQNIGSGNTGALRTSDIYVRDAQGNILAVYKEQARINGSNTIDWLNDQLIRPSRRRSSPFRPRRRLVSMRST